MSNSRYSSASINSSSGGTNSIYQRCIFMLDRLSKIPNYRESFLDPISSAMNEFGRSAAARGDDKRFSLDPVQLVWNHLRQGAGLCNLVNLLAPKAVKSISMPESLSGDGSDLSNPNNLYRTNSCKKNVYQVLVVIREAPISLPQDKMFTLSDLYLDDTNGFVRALKAVEWLLDRLEDANLIPKIASDGSFASRENSWYIGNTANANHNMPPNANRDSMSSEGYRVSVNQGGSSMQTSSITGLDHRKKVILELIETERKYVNYMEELQQYVQEANRLPPQALPRDLISQVFSNLDQLVDFQRRFLIDLENALTDDMGSIGQVFIKHEDGFSCYQQFCSNQKHGAALIVEKKDLFSRVRRMDPVVEVPSYMIKPVQRICKYPLLLKELIKVTPLDHPDYKNLLDAMNVAKHMAELVNESHRKQENLAILADLKKQVEDWKNHDVSKFGDLLLEERLKVASKDVEKELHVFLFEKIIVMFKETVSSSILKKRKSKSLQLRGNIYLREVTNIQASSAREGAFLLKIFWAGDQQDGGLRSFALKFRNEEVLNQWANTITELLPRLRKNSMASPRRKSKSRESGREGRESSGAASTSHSRKNSVGSNAPTTPISSQYYYDDASFKSGKSNKSSPNGETTQYFDGSEDDQSVKSNSQSNGSLDRSSFRMSNGNGIVASSRSLDKISEYGGSPKGSPTMKNPGPPPNLPLPPVPGASSGSNFALRPSKSASNINSGNGNMSLSNSESFSEKLDLFAKMGERGIIKPSTGSLEKLAGNNSSSNRIYESNNRRRNENEGSVSPDKRLFSFDSDEVLTNDLDRKRNNKNQLNANQLDAVPPVSPNQIQRLEDEFNELLRDAVTYNNNGTASHDISSNSAAGLPPPLTDLIHNSVVKKVKLHLHQDIYVLSLSFPISFREMQRKFQEKLEIAITDAIQRFESSSPTTGNSSSSSSPSLVMRIRYKDDDGDFVTINGDDDLIEWMEQQRDFFSNNGGGSVHFFISLHASGK